MTHYQCRVQLQADASTIYNALATPEGLRGWWTTDCDVNPQTGGVHSFRFEGILFNSMQVMESVPGERVHWKCVDGWNEWKGTEVVFTIRDGELLLEHIGLSPGLKCYKMCSQGWDTFIQKSLKDYVERGQGQPHVPKTGFKGKLARTAFKVFSSRY